MSYKNNPNVAMFLIYVNEAHPVRDSQTAPGAKPEWPSEIVRHKSLDDRVLAATACRKALKLSLPMLIDTMDGVVERAYYGVPAATAIVDLEGNIAFHSRGPHGVQPKEADRVIKRLLHDRRSK